MFSEERWGLHLQFTSNPGGFVCEELLPLLQRKYSERKFANKNFFFLKRKKRKNVK